MYKAVFIDMDGTLLQSDHTISERTKKLLLMLQQKGILVVPVSARPLHGILPITQPVITEAMPVVSLNGSYILHRGEIIRQVIIDLSNVIAVHNELQHEDAAVMFYSQMDWYAVADTALIRKEQKITPVPVSIQPFNQIIEKWRSEKNGPNKIMVGGDPALVSIIEEKLLAQHAGQLNIYKSQPRYLEVMNKDASKKTAIEFLIRQFGIRREETIAIGDNFNDKEMIIYAGQGVAMGNAPDEIKSVADFVTDTNNRDGVARALEHFFG